MHFSHANFCTGKSGINGKTFATLASSASAFFFSPFISSGFYPDIYSIIYYVYNTERSKL